MKLSGGDVLSFLDLAKYLAQYGYEYNVDNSDDRNNLRTVILNLCSDYMLHTTFYYSGAATISKYKYKNGDDFKIISTVKKKITGDFILDIDSLLKLLQNNEPIYLDGQSFEIFTAIGLDDEPIFHNHREQARKANSYFFSVRIGGEIDSPVIKMGDLHYIRADIDKAIKIGFFDHITGREQAHEKTQQLIIEAQAKITDLENQLKQVKAELANKPNIITNNKPLYITPAINIMNEVITEFWINYDPNQPAPKQSTITKWITDHFDGVSDALALNIDKVCRHSDAKSGGQYTR